jgi:hypothetical protein
LDRLCGEDSIPEETRSQIAELALEQTELSPRELAVRFAAAEQEGHRRSDL